MAGSASCRTASGSITSASARAAARTSTRSPPSCAGHGRHVDRGPVEGDWAPGYYFIVFEDPDGIRLEVNFIPGKGLLAQDPPISPSDDPDWDQNAGRPRF